jgi:hypothetical protein
MHGMLIYEQNMILLRMIFVYLTPAPRLCVDVVVFLLVDDLSLPCSSWLAWACSTPSCVCSQLTVLGETIPGWFLVVCCSSSSKYSCYLLTYPAACRWMKLGFTVEVFIPPLLCSPGRQLGLASMWWLTGLCVLLGMHTAWWAVWLCVCVAWLGTWVVSRSARQSWSYLLNSPFLS